jgi:hypothetical protein
MKTIIGSEIAASLVRCLQFLFFLTVPVGAQAQFTYVVTNQTVTITGYTGPVPGLLAIPNFMGGYPVTGIGKAAFINCLTLTTVIIPNGISNIGDAAFGRCTNLTTVVIGPDVVQMAYTFTHQLFDQFVTTGNLK